MEAVKQLKVYVGAGSRFLIRGPRFDAAAAGSVMRVTRGGRLENN